MAISVQSLFESTEDIFRLKLISGKNGISSPVSWVYYTEDVSTLNFLRGGELVITTGMSVGKNEPATEATLTNFLENLVKSIFEQKASGLILNVGKYIPFIPKKIEELCENLNIPLFTMPWEIHIIDLMEDYGNKIVQNKQNDFSLEKSLYNAIFEPEKFVISDLENTTFKNSLQFSILLLEIPKNFIENSESLKRYLDFSFNIKAELELGNFCYFIHDEKIIYILKTASFNFAKKIEKTALKDKFFNKMRISFSGGCNSALKLSEEYEHALLAFKFCNAEKLFCSYSELGIFKIFGEVKNTQVLKDFVDSVLGPLDILGKEKLKDYLTTLRIYIDSNGKLKEAAEKNSLHKNTINYRIRKISDILKVDLSNSKARYLIQTALYLMEYLKKV